MFTKFLVNLFQVSFKVGRNVRWFYSILFFSISFLNSAQNGKYSQEDISYGVGGMSIPLSFTQSKQVVYGVYTVNNPNYSQANGNTQPTFSYGNLAKVNNFSIGLGVDLHLPLIYLLACKDKSRFRIADDIGLGGVLGSNTILRRDYFTGEKLPVAGSNPLVGGSIAFWAGGQAFFRINEHFDVGVKYYPFYAYIGLGPDGGATIRGYGFHARIDKFYTDFLYITPKKIDDTHPVTYNFNVKYLFKGRNYFFINVMFNQSKGPFRINSQIPAAGLPKEMLDVKKVTSSWVVYQFGWGLLF